MCSPNSQVVYVGSHAYMVAAIDFSSGVVKWKVPVGGRIGESSPVITRDGRYLCIGTFKFLYCIHLLIYFLQLE
jgi:outer membrane protein assembly factor BamB